MIGIDLVEIERVERAIARRPRLAERLFTPTEREQCSRRARPAVHLAARFAAKEATLKALALDHLNPHEAEVRGGGDEPPELILSGAAAAEARRRGLELDVSLSHSGRLAVAAVAARARD